MRFAIWCAVSSKAQAEDGKVSLSEQEARCRTSATSKGWSEAAGPFIVPGESRTRWVNLRDAEESIPALKDMLNQAQRGAFDLLLLYDYTRLRELLDPVAKTLGAYGVQLYSLSQPVDPVPPDQYDPASTETASTMQFVSGFTSRAEISAIRRRYRLGMPRRVTEKGLPPSRIPYGYRKPPGRELDPNAVPVADPVKAPIVIQIKDLFLSGQSLWQVAHHLTAQAIPTPSGGTRWTDVITRHIMTNRFYCGEIHFGLTRRATDPRTGFVKFVLNPPSRLIVGQGKHIPLWDKGTQRRIDDEFKRRGRKYTGKRTHRLSNLLYCGVCGSRVYCMYNGYATEYKRRWVCITDRAHVNLLDSLLSPRVAEQLARDLKNFEDLQLPAPGPQSPTPDSLTAAITELKARRSRLIDAYESGVLSLTEYTNRVSSLDTRLNENENKLSNSGDTLARHRERLALIDGLTGILEQVPGYLLHAPEQEVNTQLCQILERITVTPQKVTLTFLS